MKIKTDFITNSSSSSFVIMAKDYLSNSQLEEKILKAVNIPLKSMLADFGEKVADVLVSNVRYVTIDDYLRDFGYENLSELYGIDKKIGEHYREYAYIYTGSLYTDSDNSIERMLVDIDIDFKNDEILILKASGY